MARAKSAMWADEHSDGQEAEEGCERVDSETKVKRAKDGLASLIDSGCGVRQPRHHLADLDDWIDDLAQLVGDSEAASTAIEICKEKFSKGISEGDSSLYVGWPKPIHKRADRNIAPVGHRGKDRKGNGGKGPKRPKASPAALARTRPFTRCCGEQGSSAGARHCSGPAIGGEFCVKPP